jgi:hypothetical protein
MVGGRADAIAGRPQVKTAIKATSNAIFLDMV